jgi:hypothetical protein
MCLGIILAVLPILIVTLCAAVIAKLASRQYQKRVYGVIDETIAINWQNRIALIGIAIGLLNMLSHFHFYLVSE